MGLGKFAKIAALAAGLAWATPVAAQQQIQLASDEAYVHPHSGIEVPARVGGQDRTGATAFAEDMLDVGLSFDTNGGREALSVYIFRNTNGSVPIWFAQAQAGLEIRDIYRSPDVVLQPEAFTPPGQSEASGLRATYAIDGGELQSTGLAVFEIDGWYVKIRATSASRNPQQLLDWIDEVIGDLILPEGAMRAVAPIQDCEERLRFRGRARDVESDAGGNVLPSLFGSVLSGAASAEPDETPMQAVTWCRDSALEPTQVVYRADGSDDSYLLALGDNGNGLHVAPDSIAAILGDEDEDNPSYAIRLIMAPRTLNLAPQDRMPRPRRVMQLLNENRVIGSVNTWGDERSIEVNSGALSGSKAP